jgi:hypothetical protein
MKAFGSSTAVTDDQDLPLVSVLFITYKRYDLLCQSVEAFRRNTNYPRIELVIADDGSGAEIQAKIRTLPADVFALSRRNRGLGANNNHGLRHCNGKYVLMLQDDWECQGPPDYLTQAVRVMEANPSVGLINFAGAPHPPDLNHRLEGSDEPCYLTPHPYEEADAEFFLYSDQPHLQSRAALHYLGPYREFRDMEECETDYNHRWQSQTRFGTAVFPSYHLQVFMNGDTHSFRTTRVRYKVHRLLQPAKPFLERHAPYIYRTGKLLVQYGLRALERARVIR